MNQQTIKIDVVSDIAYPWCYIGKHRLETAIEQWKETAIEVNWRPYLLNPNVPKEGWNREVYLRTKFGTTHRPEAMNRIHTAAKGEDLTLNFGEKWLGVDTLSLHQLLYAAGKEGFKSKLKERFFYAYFTENLHLNNSEVLEDIMSEFGWDTEKTKQVLNDTETLKKVKEEIRYYQEQGVSGVPYFIINNKYGISGAQPPETFLNIFKQVLNESFLSGTGDVCDLDGDCPA